MTNSKDVVEEVSENPAVETAKEQQQDNEAEAVKVLSTGVRVRLKSVSASLIDAVRARVKDPDVPSVYDDDKQRELLNPNDPKYLRELEEAEERRGQAATDAMLMFGVELLDPLPKDDSWVRQLELLGIEVDLSDSLAKEFAYKKYIAVGTPDLVLVFTASAPITQEDVAKAMANFLGDQGRGTDTEPSEA